MPDDLSGRKILVVEDEYLIAAAVNEELSHRGAVVIGPVGNLMSALSLISHELPDAALIDVNLEGSRAFPLLEELDRRSVPFLLLTGYDASVLPEKWRFRPRLTKPCTPSAIAAALAKTIA